MNDPVDDNENPRNRDGESERESGNSPREVTSTSPKDGLPPSHSNYCKPYKSQRGFFDYLKGMLEIVGLAVLCIYTAYTIKIRRATDKTANATLQSAQATRDAMKADQRAWVGVEGTPKVAVSIIGHHDVAATIKVVLLNFGKGPAFNVKDIMSIATSNVSREVQGNCNLIFPSVGLTPTIPVKSNFDISRVQLGQTIFPNQPFVTTAILPQVPDVVGKEAYVVGCIVYKDQFSEPHWTKFCYNTGDFVADLVRDASSFNHLKACNTDNYTDDTEKK